METFLEEIQLLLPVIGVDFLRRPKADSAASSVGNLNQSTVYTLKNPAKGIDAEAVEMEGEFVVLANSIGSFHVAPSFYDRAKLLRDQVLESQRAVAIDEKNFLLVENVEFNSPSAASVFLFGTSRNGRTDWLVKGTGESYSSFKERQL